MQAVHLLFLSVYTSIFPCIILCHIKHLHAFNIYANKFPLWSSSSPRAWKLHPYYPLPNTNLITSLYITPYVQTSPISLSTVQSKCPSNILVSDPVNLRHSIFNSATSSSVSCLFVNATTSKPCNIMVTSLSPKISPSLLHLPFYLKALPLLSSIHSCLHSLLTTPHQPNTILTNNMSHITT